MAAVSEVTGRPVIGFLSQVSPEPECVVEIFMFDSEPDEPAEMNHLRDRTWEGRG
jgi:hypothetical protein